MLERHKFKRLKIEKLLVTVINNKKDKGQKHKFNSSIDRIIIQKYKIYKKRINYAI